MYTHTHYVAVTTLSVVSFPGPFPGNKATPESNFAQTPFLVFYNTFCMYPNLQYLLKRDGYSQREG